jgi:hypothetical protein
LKLKFDILVSKFAFKINSYRYIEEEIEAKGKKIKKLYQVGV